ncbi:MAG: group III truncated hemoglobin [Jatrophihabitantaceae bacterium]
MTAARYAAPMCSLDPASGSRQRHDPYIIVPALGDVLVRSRDDIADRADIVGLVRDFYGRAFADELLGRIFVDIAHMDLEVHLPVMCDFWQTVLFHTGTYRRNALQPHQRLHARANLTPAHFARWLELWRATVGDRHARPKAELAKLQSSRIAGAMGRRITGTTPAAAVARGGSERGAPHCSTDARPDGFR